MGISLLARFKNGGVKAFIFSLGGFCALVGILLSDGLNPLAILGFYACLSVITLAALHYSALPRLKAEKSDGSRHSARPSKTSKDDISYDKNPNDLRSNGKILDEKPSSPIDPKLYLPDADCLPFALLVTDHHGDIIHLNEQARQFFNPPLQEGHALLPVFKEWHQGLINGEGIDAQVSSILAAADLPFSEILEFSDGRSVERLTRPLNDQKKRLWLLRDISFMREARQQESMHHSLLEADAARNAELAEQLFYAKAELEKKQAELIRLANTDSLTGLYNRRRFMALSNEHIQAQSSEHPQDLSLLMFDIDWFKKINDNYGHSVGDEVIRDFGAILQETIGDKGFVGRLGGEEFAVIMVGYDLDSAYRYGEQIRQRTEKHRSLAGQQLVSFTTSAGLSAWQPSELSVEAALDRADQALYLAKNAGRNRVHVFKQTAIAV